MQKVKSQPETEPLSSGIQLHALQKLHSGHKSEPKDFLSPNWVSYFGSMSLKGSSRLWTFWWDLLLLKKERGSYFYDWMRFRLVETLGLATRVPRCTRGASATCALPHLTSSPEQTSQCQEFVSASATQRKKLPFMSKFYSVSGWEDLITDCESYQIYCTAYLITWYDSLIPKMLLTHRRNLLHLRKRGD